MKTMIAAILLVSVNAFGMFTGALNGMEFISQEEAASINESRANALQAFQTATGMESADVTENLFGTTTLTQDGCSVVIAYIPAATFGYNARVVSVNGTCD